MTVERIKVVAASIACGALVVAGGSGDSATGTTYVQPTASAMKLPSTVVDKPEITNEEAPTTLAIPMAAPTYKATPAPGCVNNGQCP